MQSSSGSRSRPADDITCRQPLTSQRPSTAPSSQHYHKSRLLRENYDMDSMRIMPPGINQRKPHISLAPHLRVAGSKAPKTVIRGDSLCECSNIASEWGEPLDQPSWHPFSTALQTTFRFASYLEKLSNWRTIRSNEDLCQAERRRPLPT